MKLNNNILMALVLYFIYTNYCYGQSNDDSIFPQLSVGGGIGYFGSSVNNFEKIYGSNGGFTYGFDGSIQFMTLRKDTRIYGLIQYYIFNRSGTTIGDYKVDIDWNETIFDIGGRYCWQTQGTRSWIGGGVSQPNVIEKFTLLGESIKLDDTASGFYLEYGSTWESSLFLNIKFSTGEIEGQGGVSGDWADIGGFSLIIGMLLQ